MRPRGGRLVRELGPAYLLLPLLLLPPTALLFLLEATADLGLPALLLLTAVPLGLLFLGPGDGCPAGGLLLGGLLEIVHDVAEQGVGIVPHTPFDLGLAGSGRGSLCSLPLPACLPRVFGTPSHEFMMPAGRGDVNDHERVRGGGSWRLSI